MTRLTGCPRCQSPILASIESPGYTRHGERIRVVFYRCTNGHTVKDPDSAHMPDDAPIPLDWLDGYRRLYQNDVDNGNEKD